MKFVAKTQILLKTKYNKFYDFKNSKFKKKNIS